MRQKSKTENRASFCPTRGTVPTPMERPFFSKASEVWKGFYEAAGEASAPQSPADLLLGRSSLPELEIILSGCGLHVRNRTNGWCTLGHVMGNCVQKTRHENTMKTSTATCLVKCMLEKTSFFDTLELLGCNRVSVEGDRLCPVLPETLCWPPEL